MDIAHLRQKKRVIVLGVAHLFQNKKDTFFPIAHLRQIDLHILHDKTVVVL